ncbi:unnamed protein product [Linum trigynum]|uniref:Uncharacterized protein n=1 Tax=Linum trigynum TaxID=586398 RepID=A0AAV2E9R9_9ROSI
MGRLADLSSSLVAATKAKTEREEDLVVVMKEETSQGTVRGKNMFSRVYSRKARQKIVVPVVQEMVEPAIASTFDDVVELVVKLNVEDLESESIFVPEVMALLLIQLFKRWRSQSLRRLFMTWWS